MTTLVESARQSRMSLVRALGALQSDGAPPSLMDAAEPVAEAMGALHQLESSAGASAAESAPLALAAARRALGRLQEESPDDPHAQAALEAVAGALGLIHQLVKATAAAAAPTAHPPGRASAPQQQAAPAAQHAPAPHAPPPAAAHHAPTPHHAPPPAATHHAPERHPAPQASAPAVAESARPEPRHVPTPPAPAPQPAAQPQRRDAEPIPLRRAQQPSERPAQVAPAAAHAPLAATQAATRAAPAAPVAPPVAQAPARAPAATPDAPAGDTVMTATEPNGEARVGGMPELELEASLAANSSSNFWLGLTGSDIVRHGGVFIETFRAVPVGTRVSVQLFLPGGFEFRAQGVVAWSRESGTSPGCGVRFTALSSEGESLIARYVRKREPLLHDDL